MLQSYTRNDTFMRLLKEYLLLHKPDYHDFQSYIARSTSDCTRPNVDYRKSKLIRTNGTYSK